MLRSLKRTDIKVRCKAAGGCPDNLKGQPWPEPSQHAKGILNARQMSEIVDAIKEDMTPTPGES